MLSRLGSPVLRIAVFEGRVKTAVSFQSLPNVDADDDADNSRVTRVRTSLFESWPMHSRMGHWMQWDLHAMGGRDVGDASFH